MSDNSEAFKCGIHFALFSLVSMAAGYNLMQFGAKHDPRHLANSLIYASLLVFESGHIKRHLKATNAPL